MGPLGGRGGRPSALMASRQAVVAEEGEWEGDEQSIGAVCFCVFVVAAVSVASWRARFVGRTALCSLADTRADMRASAAWHALLGVC